MGVAAVGLDQQHRLGHPGVAAAQADPVHGPGDGHGVGLAEAAAGEGGGGVGEGAELAGEADLAVGGAAGHVEAVAEPGGAGGGGVVVLTAALDGLVEEVDEAGDGGVELVAEAEGGGDEEGERLGGEVGRGAGAEACDGLMEAREGLEGVGREVDGRGRTHVRSLPEHHPQIK